MSKPDSQDISRFDRFFAIESNNEFWSLSEGDLGDGDKQQLLALAFSSLYHWSRVGTEDNVQLANMAIARAFCINELPIALQYAEIAYEHFNGKGEDWIQAFTNAILSHALLIVGENVRSRDLYKTAIEFQSKLTEGDRKVFDATFSLIPVPQSLNM